MQMHQEYFIEKGKNLLFPDWWKLLGFLVVASKTMNPAFNKNESEFRILILPVPLQVLSNCNCLLDQVV